MARSMSANNKKNSTREGRSGLARARDTDGGVSGVSSRITTWERKARSLSPVRKGARAVDSAEVVETRAQMAVLADATGVVSCREQSSPLP